MDDLRLMPSALASFLSLRLHLKSSTVMTPVDSLFADPVRRQACANGHLRTSVGCLSFCERVPESGLIASVV